MVQEEPLRLLKVRRNPVHGGDRGYGPRLGRLQALGKEKLRGTHALQLRGHLFGSDLGYPELPGADVYVGDPRLVTLGHQRDQIVVRLLFQQVGLYHGARGHDPDHLSLHQALGERGVSNLLAYGYLVPPLYQPGQIAVQGVIRDAGHGVPLPPAHLPGGQGDAQLPGCDMGVFIEGLVEVAEAEEDEDIGVLPLDAEVLSADGCGAHSGLLSAILPKRASTIKAQGKGQGTILIV